jgi:predicted TIM-barrel fold metal-dependent hydrolase
MIVVDSHQHVGSLSDALAYDGTDSDSEPAVESDASRRLTAMDALGIDWAVLQPSHGYLRTDGLMATMRLNDRMVDYMLFTPDRFCVLGTTEPMYGMARVHEVQRIASMGLRGVAWHHRFQGCYIDSRWMWPILEAMSDLELIPLVHVNVESSMEAHWRLQRLALDFPNLTFLAMDGLWSYERARHALASAGITPNVIWDMGGPVCYVSAEEWVERNGSTTLCFSANLHYVAEGTIQETPLLRYLKTSELSEADKANILGGNLTRLFGLE